MIERMFVFDKRTNKTATFSISLEPRIAGYREREREREREA